MGLAFMGGAGMLSVSIVLPVMGRIYDQGIASRLSLGQHPTPSIEAAAGLQVLGKIAVLPCVLIVLFLIVFSLQKHFRSGLAKN
jgi:hypothetical protein